MYQSSLLKKYGDLERVNEDIKTLKDILQRQGTSLLIDCISEMSGRVVNEFKLNKQERETLIRSLVNELRESMLERI